jgi:hypothetical protein
VIKIIRKIWKMILQNAQIHQSTFLLTLGGNCNIYEKYFKQVIFKSCISQKRKKIISKRLKSNSQYNNIYILKTEFEYQ